MDDPNVHHNDSDFAPGWDDQWPFDDARKPPGLIGEAVGWNAITVQPILFDPINDSFCDALT